LKRLCRFFFGPPSDRQVVGIERTILFPELTNHPLISETLIGLQRKFQTEGRREGNCYLIQFDNGEGVTTNQPLPIACSGQSGCKGAGQADIPNINKRGDRDIVLHVEFRPGCQQTTRLAFSSALKKMNEPKLT
jgi:hypothetical protein